MYHKRKPIFTRIFSNPASLTILGLLVLIIISLPLVKNIKKQISFNKEISILEKEIDNLEGKNTELKGLITYLNSNDFAEEQARLNLNYKKEGEEVLIIKDKDEEEINKQNNSDSPKSIYNIQGLDNKPEIKEDNNFKKWIKHFIN